MRSSPVRRIHVLAIALAFVTTGCSKKDSPTSPATIAGTYTLRTINGSPLPYVVLVVGADKVEAVDDAITLSDAGTWTEFGHVRTTISGVATTTTINDAGSYVRTGTAITLTSPQSGPLSGTVDNGTLTLSDQGLVGVYRK